MSEKGRAININDKDAVVNASPLVWHLPLLVVEENNKTCIGHNAKASADLVSLNSMLLGGPNLTNNLASILLNFQVKQSVFTTIIAAFFHQAKVIKKVVFCYL